MEFIETPVFTELITDLLSDGDYRKLQIDLLLNPKAGDVIKGTGGLRKIRFQLPGRGKRGGLRVIYYLDMPDKIYMIYVYKKTTQSDLTQEQKKALKKLVQECLL